VTRQRSRAHSINSPGSVPEDGDGAARRGIPERKAHFPIIQIVAFARGQVRLTLGKKQQNQQNSAREYAHKSLEFAGELLPIVQFYRNRNA
jgi:hypothetical protein